MNIRNKLTAAVLALCVALQIATLICVAKAPAATENNHEIRYETMTKFGDIDENGTLFVDSEGNLFALDAVFAEETGTEFVLKMDGHGTETPTDDEILDVMIRPQKY